MRDQFMRFAKPLVVRHLPRVAAAYELLKEERAASADPVATPMGFKLAGSTLMQSGAFEPEETRLVKTLVSQSDLLINVGANIGYYVCMAVSQGKNVVAFEPLHQNVRLLLRNIKANDGDSKVEVHPVALSNSVGIREIYGRGTGASLVKGWAGAPERQAELVPCTTMDNVLHDRYPDARLLIVVDVEGAEQLILEGAASVLAREPKPLWMVEIAKSEHQPAGVSINPTLLDTFCVFWQGGYQAWTADSKCRKVDYQEVARIAEGGPDTLGTNNFLFLEQGLRERLLGVDRR
jgi:FkbM family methyltransferase